MPQLDLLVFPNQLFDPHPAIELEPERVIYIEDSLFWGDWNYPLKFHKQKLWLHRATMKRHEAATAAAGFQTLYFDHDDSERSMDKILKKLCKS